MAVSELLGGFGNFGIGGNTLTWLLYIVLIFLVTMIVCAFFYHFVVRKMQFNILVERKRLIKQDGKHYLIDDTNEWGKLSRDKTRMILKSQGKFRGYLQKIKYSAPPEDYIRPTLFGTRKVTMVFNGYNDLEYTYTKNKFNENDISIESVEIDSLGIVISDTEAEMKKRRLSSPIQQIATIGALVVITLFFIIGMVFITVQNKDIAKANSAMAGACGHIEDVCTQYIQMNEEMCEKKVQAVCGGQAR